MSDDEDIGCKIRGIELKNYCVIERSFLKNPSLDPDNEKGSLNAKPAFLIPNFISN